MLGKVKLNKVTFITPYKLWILMYHNQKSNN